MSNLQTPATGAESAQAMAVFAIRGHVRTLRLSGRNDGMVEDMEKAADALEAAQAAALEAASAERARIVRRLREIAQFECGCAEDTQLTLENADQVELEGDGARLAATHA